MPPENDFTAAQKPAPGALTKAMKDGSGIDAVENLLRQGADVDETGNDGLTSLMLAAWRGDEELARLLLKYGADVNINKSGITAMMWAASGGYLNLARLLIDKVADINEKTSDLGNTALIWAAVKDHAEMVEFLLSKGAAVNQADHWGNTALIVAALKGYAAPVRILIDNGADMRLKNLDGNTAQDCARKKERTDVTRMLQEAVNAVEARQRRIDEAEKVRMQHDIASGKQESMKHRARKLPRPGA